jgi:hypothetical protein
VPSLLVISAYLTSTFSLTIDFANFDKYSKGGETVSSLRSSLPDLENKKIGIDIKGVFALIMRV